MRSVVQKKGARRDERPSQSDTRSSLVLRSTLLGGVIPSAASLVAASLVGWRPRLERKLRGHGNRNGQSEHGHKRFHSFTALGLLLILKLAKSQIGLTTPSADRCCPRRCA